MITQKAISVKLDSYQLELLDELCSNIGCNRNKLINFGVYMVNNYLRDHERCSLVSAYALALDAFND